MTVRRVGSRVLKRALAGKIPLARALGLGDEVREELLWEAGQRLDRDETAEAELLFGVVLGLWNDRPDGPLGLGVCRLKEGRIAEALELFRLSERWDGSNPFTLSNLAECALLQGDRSAASGFLDRIDQSSDPRKGQMTERIAHLRQLASTSEPPVV